MPDLEMVQETLDLIDSLQPMKKRRPPVLMNPEKMTTPEHQFHWVTHHWIPSQTDFEKLGRLMVMLKWNVPAFIAAVHGRRRFNEYLEQAYGS